jgi:PhnB protein
MECAMKLNTYINFPGNCEQAMHFYVEHLGAKINMLGRFKDMPEPQNLMGCDPNAVMHARIEIAGVEIMMSDGPPGRVEPMRSAYLALTVDTPEEAEWFNGLLGDQGVIFMPMTESFFAYRFSMLRDRFGVSWMIICPKLPE